MGLAFFLRSLSFHTVSIASGSDNFELQVRLEIEQIRSLDFFSILIDEIDQKHFLERGSVARLDRICGSHDVDAELFRLLP